MATNLPSCINSKLYFAEISYISEKLWLFNHRRADFVASKFWNLFSLLRLLKDIHRRQKLTTDFFRPFELTILVVNILISRKKNMLTVVSRGSFFKELDNKIIGFAHI